MSSKGMSLKGRISNYAKKNGIDIFGGDSARTSGYSPERRAHNE